MTISYNWLSEYLPVQLQPKELSIILTSIGLEVESEEAYESVKGGLKGLVIGEVLTCEQHPNADKLKVTTVNIGLEQPIQVVCGAANVAAGQKVVVATVGTTIYPVTGEPLTMKIAKIRGVESFGMICAEDEIGLGHSHDGIIVLPNEVVAGTKAADYFQIYQDTIFEIGLTPNRMDAMSHWGVAKDVCAYLTYHKGNPYQPILPVVDVFTNTDTLLPFKVTVHDVVACPRYCGVAITNVAVTESPVWLKNKLQAIGLRPINNIVDVTNFILHETGQPLHAFDAHKIAGHHIQVQQVAANTSFITLDGKERKLSNEDLMICDGNGNPLCIAGVFGGIDSGVSAQTQHIFLESACFAPISIRKTSVKHGLRTDAATRFEKGVDISNTLKVLQRAVLLIQQVAGGSICAAVQDVYPQKTDKTSVTLSFAYLKKLSGKYYTPDSVQQLLTALGFEVIKQTTESISVLVPYSKPDISLPADLVEEIVRIDGLDNIEIPATITISPATESLSAKEALKEKIAGVLVGMGFSEIFTNSITNSKYYSAEVLTTSVKMLNSLSAELDILRPSMLETGLETVAYNNNRKIPNLLLFEYGKTYHTQQPGNYTESERLALYISGNSHDGAWNEKSTPRDFFFAKGVLNAIASICGLGNIVFAQTETANAQLALSITAGNLSLGSIQQIAPKKLNEFDIKQPVYFIDIDFGQWLQAALRKKITYKEVSKFPIVQRDLALVIEKSVTYQQIEQAIRKAKLTKLQSVRLFDVFESDKLGVNKKSVAVNFSFLDEEKTLTDKETDQMMQTLITVFEKEFQAIIRK